MIVPRAPGLVRWTIAATLALAGGWAGEPCARADEPPQAATFALIIGSNHSVDPDVPPLKYADDDAARYLDLFRLLGARTYLLARLDDNTRGLHPQAAGEAIEPRSALLATTLAQVAADVAHARDRRLDTVLYVVYAGHGGVDERGEGYITLEDARITGADLARMVASVPASRVHIIADACASYFLAYSRGPGGDRRPVRGFQDSPQLSDDPRVGLLLSTSSQRESHEWDEYQSGIFSHEVRSGLYGAADADGDGRVSYREIAAFVTRANAAVPNERYRPDVHAKAPPGSDLLMDLRHAMERHLDVSGAHAAHYWMEDGQGVRLLDFHNGPNDTVRIVRPGPSGHVYLRRKDDGSELAVPPWPNALAFDDLHAGPSVVASRGGAHESFDRLFTLPFGESTVTAYVASPVVDRPLEGVRATRSQARSIIGWSAVGVGVAALATGGVLSASAITISRHTSQDASSSVSEASLADRNARIADQNHAAAAMYVTGGVGVAAGLLVLLWPPARHVSADLSARGASLSYATRFW